MQIALHMVVDAIWRPLIVVRLPMKIGTAAILLKAQAQRIGHRFRRRIGDRSKRASCCDPMPVEYPKGSLVSIPGLAQKLDKVSELWAEHSTWYACRVCGQEWIEQFIAYPVEAPIVRKAI